MQATKPFILYTLPKSRTTQAFLDGNKIERIWESLDYFFTNCTTTSINNPSSTTLTAYSAVDVDKNPELADKFAFELKEIFGTGKSHKMGEGFPTEIDWKISTQDLSKALDYLKNGQPWPKFTFGPVELLISYDFKLIDLSNNIELQGQEITSSIMIWLSKRCSCSTDLWLPFEDANNDFNIYIKKLETFLPFKLEHKYFKRGRPNKNGTNHIFNKLFK